MSKTSTGNDGIYFNEVIESLKKSSIACLKKTREDFCSYNKSFLIISKILCNKQTENRRNWRRWAKIENIFNVFHKYFPCIRNSFAAAVGWENFSFHSCQLAHGKRCLKLDKLLKSPVDVVFVCSCRRAAQVYDFLFLSLLRTNLALFLIKLDGFLIKVFPLNAECAEIFQMHTRNRSKYESWEYTDTLVMVVY